MPNQNKVQNPESPVAKTPQMNDRDFINDMLTTQKYFSNSYSVALNEMSNQALFQDIFSVSKENQEMQRELYNLMFEKGWYSLEKAQATSLGQSYQQFSGYKNQFPSGTNIQ
ncbi:spore coat protein [Peribacillus sp. NPDC006672]|uniref:spore coat protein n=1 Tax=Peribacillus sp. NPDC006672 TaxID=3390606 RepID=UPI003D0746CB